MSFEFQYSIELSSDEMNKLFRVELRIDDLLLKFNVSLEYENWNTK